MDLPFRKHRNDGSSSPGAGNNSDGLVSKSAARAALSFLEEAGSKAPEQLRQQINNLYKDLLRDLGHNRTDNMIVMTPDQLRGVIASALITGAAQVAMERNVISSLRQRKEAPKGLDTDDPLASTIAAEAA